MDSLFFELLQVAIGTRDKMSRVPTNGEWQELYAMSIKQAVTGLMFSGIERLYNDNIAYKPSMPLFYEWFGGVCKIEEENVKLNNAAGQLTTIFKNGGLRCCVLKGQGVATLYPESLRRQSGDIDLWVEGSREKTLKFLKDNNFGIGKIVIHHVDAHIIDGVATEIHFIPSYTFDYLRYIKFKRFFSEESDGQFNYYDERLGFAYPTNRFNAVYLMLHIFRHVFHEGIGLRQLLDYYYVLVQLSEEEQKWAYKKLRWLGLKTFAGAVMYVQKKVFLIEDNYLLCEPSEKAGEFLLEEIFKGGNFGKYDEQYIKTHSSKGVKLYIIRLKRLVRVFSLCPSEVMCAPFWKPLHQLWRRAKGYA